MSDTRSDTAEAKLVRPETSPTLFRLFPLSVCHQAVYQDVLRQIARFQTLRLAALAEYLDQRDDLQGGRMVRSAATTT